MIQADGYRDRKSRQPTLPQHRARGGLVATRPDSLKIRGGSPTFAQGDPEELLQGQTLPGPRHDGAPPSAGVTFARRSSVFRGRAAGRLLRRPTLHIR